MKAKNICKFREMTTPFITVCKCLNRDGAKWTETKVAKRWLCKFHTHNEDCPNYVKNHSAAEAVNGNDNV